MNLSPLPIQKFFANNGRPLAGGKLFTYVAGTTTKIATYTDSSGVTPNTNPIVLDFRGECRLWLDPTLTYKFILSPENDTDPPMAPIWTVDTINVSPEPFDNSAVDTGTTNNITLAIPRISSPVAFTRIVFKAIHTNTGATTISINGGAAKPVILQDGIAVTGGEIVANGIYEAVYDGGSWQLQGYSYALNDARHYGYVADATDGTDTGTDNTTALQNALNANAGGTLILPGGVGLFHYLTVPTHTSIIGQGPRSTILRQYSTETNPALTFGGSAGGGDISDGAFQLKDFCIKVATGANGIVIGQVQASMFETDQFRLWSQQTEALTVPPYTTVSGQTGIVVNPNSTSSCFFASHRLLEIRSFDIAVDAKNIVNEWYFPSAWIIDCRVAFRLQLVSTWNLNGATVESGVSNARCLQTFGAVSNILWIGGRWELTQAGGYGIECDGTTTGQNWIFEGTNVIINGDGSAIPGRKWTGSVPNCVVFRGYDAGPLPFVVTPNLVSMRLPNLLLVGGQNVGNGKITWGRNANNTALSIIEHDGTHFLVRAGNSLRLSGDGTTNFKVDVNNTGVAFQGTAAIAKPTVTGSRGGNAALASLLTAFANYGLITDSTTA